MKLHKSTTSNSYFFSKQEYHSTISDEDIAYIVHSLEHSIAGYGWFLTSEGYLTDEIFTVVAEAPTFSAFQNKYPELFI